MKVGSHKIKNRNLIITGIVISVGFILTSVIRNGLQDRYVQDILNYRKQKADHFKTAEDSPIEDQPGFTELNYFEPDKKYRTKPSLVLLKDSSFVKINNNDGEKNKYWRYAKAIFTIGDKKDTLVVYRKASLPAEDKNYFIPFFDATNGDGTYDGGRYIDLEIKDTSLVVLDFNLAYNPYCVYNYRFSCPIPPKENTLNSRIEAGEKMYSK